MFRRCRARSTLLPATVVLTTTVIACGAQRDAGPAGPSPGGEDKPVVIASSAFARAADDVWVAAEIRSPGQTENVILRCGAEACRRFVPNGVPNGSRSVVGVSGLRDGSVVIKTATAGSPGSGKGGATPPIRSLFVEDAPAGDGAFRKIDVPNVPGEVVVWGDAPRRTWVCAKETYGCTRSDGRALPADNGFIGSVSGSSADDVWFLGGGVASPRLRHWTGSSAVDVPIAGTGWQYLHASAVGELWAPTFGGPDNRGALLHGDGTTMTEAWGKPFSGIDAVWSSGADDVWAFADGIEQTLLHWNGFRLEEIALARELSRQYGGLPTTLTGTRGGDLWITHFGTLWRVSRDGRVVPVDRVPAMTTGT